MRRKADRVRDVTITALVRLLLLQERRVKSYRETNGPAAQADDRDVR